MKYSRKRGIVVGLVFASVAVGLVLHTATGTESALGWRDIAAICPVGALEVLAGNHGLALHAVLLLAGTLVLALAFGKSFCAWFCPTPYVRALFGVRRRKSETTEGERAGVPDTREGTLPPSEGVSKRAAAATTSAPTTAGARPLAPCGGARDGRRIDSRHAVLLGAVGSSFIFGFPVFCLVCPIGITFAIVIGVFNLVVHADTSWGLIVFPALLVVELVVCRRWCTHLCPVSALLSLLAARLPRRLRPRVDAAMCLRQRGVDCRVCVGECPEAVDPHSKVIPECSNCGKCVDACPAQAIALAWEKRLPQEAPVESSDR